MFPLFASWQTDYNKTNTKVNITTAATGSGTGIADATAGIVTMGGSDAYLSPAEIEFESQFAQYPAGGLGGDDQLQHARRAQPSESQRQGHRPDLSGKITTWNNSAIKAVNPGV